MILGTYWFYKFPTGLYKLEYFNFSEGIGGIGYGSSSLYVYLKTKYVESIIEDLNLLIEKYYDGFLCIYYEKQKLKIMMNSYHFFDYDFLFAIEVEEVLKNYNIHLLTNIKLANPSFIRMYNEKNKNKFVYPQKGFLQVVSSGFKKNNAQNLGLRFDCNLSLSNKAEFIVELKNVVNEEKIDVFYFYEKDFNFSTNLMLFFSNGRQGLNFINKKFVDILSFEDKIDNIANIFKQKKGHIGGLDLFTYSKNGPIIEKIIDKDYTL